MFIPGEGSVLDYYIDQAVKSIRYQKRIRKASIARVWFMRHLNLQSEPEFYGELIDTLIERGILVPKGKRLMIGVLPVPKKMTRFTAAELVDREYAEKSEAEKAAIARSGALASQTNNARERRNARRAQAMMRGMR